MIWFIGFIINKINKMMIMMIIVKEMMINRLNNRIIWIRHNNRKIIIKINNIIIKLINYNNKLKLCKVKLTHWYRKINNYKIIIFKTSKINKI